MWMRKRFSWTVPALVAVGALAGAGDAGAATRPARPAAEAIVQFDAGVAPAARRAAVHAVGGRVVRDLHVIRGLGVRLPAGAAARLARTAGVKAVTPNAAVRPSSSEPGAGGVDPSSSGPGGGFDPGTLATAFVQSTRADKAWADSNSPATGAGVTVAVIDTGVAGDLPDFVRSDGQSRVIASAVTNPNATTATDRYGHGTHVAGLVAGDTRTLPSTDPLYGRYIGTAPEAQIVSIKASDDHGNSSLIDVIAGLQFAVDHKDDYGIRVINLSMDSSLALPYRLDPLDAAAESAWFHGIVVVSAAGNRGTAADAVSYAPANDPYVLTVGGVDDHGTTDTSDDTLAAWSSRGVTQDGIAKPELVAPGAHIVAPLAPDSDFASLCPACVTDGRYFRIGGTSMAAPIVAGIAADVISVHPDWTPDEVKGALMHEPRETADQAFEVSADTAVRASAEDRVSNQGLSPNYLVDPATGNIDYSRASWSRASWSTAADALRASWSRASWSCTCGAALTGGVDTSRASWSRASWSSFFGPEPSTYGELKGGTTGAAPSEPGDGSSSGSGGGTASAPTTTTAAAGGTTTAPAGTTTTMAPAGTTAPAPSTTKPVAPKARPKAPHSARRKGGHVRAHASHRRRGDSKSRRARGRR